MFVFVISAKLVLKHETAKRAIKVLLPQPYAEQPPMNVGSAASIHAKTIPNPHLTAPNPSLSHTVAPPFRGNPRQSFTYPRRSSLKRPPRAIFGPPRLFFHRETLKIHIRIFENSYKIFSFFTTFLRASRLKNRARTTFLQTLTGLGKVFRTLSLFYII